MQDLQAVRLRRPLVSRLLATILQGYLSLGAALSVAAVLGVLMKPDLSLWPYLIAPVLLVVLWLRGATAWARIDEDGLHWRYWARWDHPWDTIAAITLTRRAVYGHHGAAAAPIILVRSRGGDEDVITPARACGRHRRDFGSAALAAARAHGVRTEVVSARWNEEPSRIAEPWE